MKAIWMGLSPACFCNGWPTALWDRCSAGGLSLQQLADAGAAGEIRLDLRLELRSAPGQAGLGGDRSSRHRTRGPRTACSSTTWANRPGCSATNCARKMASARGPLDRLVHLNNVADLFLEEDPDFVLANDYAQPGQDLPVLESARDNRGRIGTAAGPSAAGSHGGQTAD